MGARGGGWVLPCSPEYHRTSVISPPLVFALSTVLWGLYTPEAAYGQGTCPTPWIATEDLRIGTVAGDVTLEWVRDLSVGPSGKVYVVEEWSQSVSVFDSAGQPLGRVGRPGSGPGEFGSSPNALGFRGDTLWATDRFRTQFFAPDGSPVRQASFRIPIPSEATNMVSGTPLADDTYLGFRLLRPPVDAFYSRDWVPLRRFSETGSVVDTIAMVPPPPTVAIPRSGGLSFSEHPLTAWQGASWLPVVATADGTAVVLVGDVRESGASPSFDLVKIGIQGDTIFKRTIPYTPRPVSNEEYQFLKDSLAASYAGDFLTPEARGRVGGSAERRRAAARDAFHAPDFHPPVRRIHAGADGTIWLLRESVPAPVDRWEVRGPEGELEGTVEFYEGRSRGLPWAPRVRVLHTTRDVIWGVTIDELDVAYVHRFSIDRACS